MTRRIRLNRQWPVLRRRGPRAAPRKRRPPGVSLVEVLVALLVMGIGVLGVIGLQVLSMQNGRAALLQSEAAQLAQDMMDRIRANSGDRRGTPAHLPLALGDVPPAPANCGSHQCSAKQMAVFDQSLWKCSLGNFPDHPVCVAMRDYTAVDALPAVADRPGLPEGDGAVALDAATGLVRVTVQWREGKSLRSVFVESRI